jgi:hypothetical protein
MSDVLVQLSYVTKGGDIVPLATSQSAALAQVVARHILDELACLKFEDEMIELLATQERHHVARLMRLFGVYVANVKVKNTTVGGLRVKG